MDNYLNHRWPQGPGLQPPPLPSSQPPRPRRKSRRVRRWLVPAVAVVLCLSLLGGICAWAVGSIADMIVQADPGLPEDPRPRISRRVDDSPGWSADDLPWGEPDPSVRLSTHPAGPALSGREAYRRVLPTLVCVEAAHADPFDGVSVGTGVVVAEEGYVLTNYHIIDETVSVRVHLLDDPGDSYDAKVIGFDEEFDIAVLRFEPGERELTAAQLGDSDELAVGDWVYAVGNPMGYLLGSMSVGVVSALDRDEDASGSALGLIQTDAVLNPGNSGGALMNESGQVVGITCAKITGVERESGDSIENSVVLEGMGLAIPITAALPFVNHILATGETWRPAMGITCQAKTVDGRKGISVATVNDGVPAQEAGLMAGDLIVAANGKPVASLVELRRVLYRVGVDGELTCTVVRDGAELEISFALIELPRQDD